MSAPSRRNAVRRMTDDVAVRESRRGLMKSLSKTEGLDPDGTPTKELSDEWNERQ